MPEPLEDHGEHYCGSTIFYDPRHDVHTCTGMHDDPDLVIEPDECGDCLDREVALDDLIVHTSAIAAVDGERIEALEAEVRALREELEMVLHTAEDVNVYTHDRLAIIVGIVADALAPEATEGTPR